MKFYTFYPETNDSQGVAHAPEGVSFELLYRKGVIAEWEPFEFCLKGGVFSDYQWNNLGWHVCSDKLRAILSRAASAEDQIQWLPVKIKGAGTALPYHVMHLPAPVDVLSRRRSIYSGEILVKPVLDASKIGTHKIFTSSGEGVHVYVAEDVKDLICAASITGLELLKQPVDSGK